MATTTNYSWSTPDDTALVKDGAAAIRSLGTAIDTTVFNNAGAAIAKTIVDAKGDLIIGSAADTVARLAVGGTNGHVLTVNSGATYGAEWAALPQAGGMTLISTTTLTGASVTLSSIPATYKNLQLVIRNLKPSVDGENITWRINADSGANRHASRFSVFAANQSFDSTSCSTVYSNDNSVDTNMVVVNFFDYANTTTWKMMQSQELLVNLTTTTNFNYGIGQHAYNQIDAISSLVLAPSSGNFTSGTALLYGVA
jgi:hypothetical protein